MNWSRRLTQVELYYDRQTVLCRVILIDYINEQCTKVEIEYRDFGAYVAANNRVCVGYGYMFAVQQRRTAIVPS